MIEFPCLNYMFYQVTQQINAGQQYIFPINNNIKSMCFFAVLSIRAHQNAGRWSFVYLGSLGYWYISDSISKNLWSSWLLPPDLTRFLMNAYNLQVKYLIN